MKHISFSPDFFITGLLHVIFCDTELGTLQQLSNGYLARTPDGREKLATSADSGSKWLLDCHNKPATVSKAILNQFTLF